MKQMITLTTITLGCILAITVNSVFSEAGPLGEVAIYTDRSGWIAQPTAKAEGEELAGLLKKPTDVVTLGENELKTWQKNVLITVFLMLLSCSGTFQRLFILPVIQNLTDLLQKISLREEIYSSILRIIFFTCECGRYKRCRCWQNMMDINIDMWTVELLSNQVLTRSNIRQVWWLLPQSDL